MGKRGVKGKKRGGDHSTDDSDFDDRSDADRTSLAAASIVSEVTDDKDGRIKISEAAEMLSEKRTSTRETGLKKLLKILRSNSKALVDMVEGYMENITLSLTRILKRPSSVAEAVSTMEVVCLLSLLMGAGDSELFEQFEKPLLKLVAGVEGFEDLRVQSLATLVFMSFICCSDENADNLMTLCEEILVEEAEGLPVTPPLRARAAKSWILLSSVVTDSDVLERSREGFFESVSALLDESDSDVKIAGGTALAALWEVAYRAVPDSDYTESGRELCSNPSDVADTVAKLQRIAKESSKRVAKKDRKEQRAALRDAEDWITNGERFQSETVRMQGAVLEVESFATLRLLEELRDVLGDGFPSCLRVFPVLRDVLSVPYLTDDMDGDGSKSNVGKGSSTEKLRSSYRKQERRFREVCTEYLAYEDDGGDF